MTNYSDLDSSFDGEYHYKYILYPIFARFGGLF